MGIIIQLISCESVATGETAKPCLFLEYQSVAYLAKKVFALGEIYFCYHISGQSQILLVFVSVPAGSI